MMVPVRFMHSRGAKGAPERGVPVDGVPVDGRRKCWLERDTGLSGKGLEGDGVGVLGAYAAL